MTSVKSFPFLSFPLPTDDDDDDDPVMMILLFFLIFFSKITLSLVLLACFVCLFVFAYLPKILSLLFLATSSSVFTVSHCHCERSPFTVTVRKKRRNNCSAKPNKNN